ncbi:hypothetical protein EPUL_000065 [Erysiphe pulchra]|uniref:Helitron helicase-like domain-containing protein n=1 Tax=Erysiphe pulchra TaxID=225359 RepID=A0A2S4Q1V6_9PEZI|nr:hypothetical protein EPUL_000065 [Erysiphe pulchra]
MRRISATSLASTIVLLRSHPSSIQKIEDWLKEKSMTGAAMRDGAVPRYAQFYFVGSKSAVEARTERENLNSEIVTRLTELIQQNNPFVEYYHTALRSLQDSELEGSLRVVLNPDFRLVVEPHTDRRRYNLPTTDEIAVVIPDAADRNTRDSAMAMAIARALGNPSMFTTITANPSWSEILAELEHNQTPDSRLDLIAKVFKLKLDQMLHDLKERYVCGVSTGSVYTTEYQKRVGRAQVPKNDPELAAILKSLLLHGLGSGASKCSVYAGRKMQQRFSEKILRADDDGGELTP